MHGVVFVILFSIPILVLGQSDTDLFGKSKASVITIKNEEWAIKPCDNVERVVTYCVSNGAKIMFLFNNTSFTLTDIILVDPSISKSQAETDVSKLILDFKKKYGVEPSYYQGTAYFSLPGVPYRTSFDTGFFENAHWVVEGYHSN
tara:strand:- start:64 stop:501 length:438 start_codon:yes stop_codon:yes gene_type:complete